MSSSPRRGVSNKASSGAEFESVSQKPSHTRAEEEGGSAIREPELRKSPKQALKQRPSRWADEVDEDDQFIPSTSPQQSTKVIETSREQSTRARQPIPLRRQVSKEEGRFSRGTRDQGYQTKGRPTYDSRGKRDLPVSQRPRSPKQPSKEQMEEIAHMKEVMAKKAEEKKRLKQEEEARAEAERRARCEAKLREMEDKHKQKVSSGASTPVYTPVVDAELEAKRAAFNQRRYEVRQKREGKPVGTISSSPLAPGSPTAVVGGGSSSVSPTRLSPHAAEFVPNIQHPPPPPAPYYHPMHQPQHMHPPHPHWMPAGHPHPYYGAPQMWHPQGQWPPHGVPPYGAGGHPGYPGHQFPPSPAPQQYDPRDL
jgi:hypothetical protein